MEYLDADDLCEISPGGAKSVRDLGLLEAAAARPAAGFGGEKLFPDLFAKAAALLEAVCNYHPFIDGNKRTAWLAGLVFLRLNGQLVEAEEDSAVEFVLAVARSELDLTEIATWLERHSSGASS